MVVAKLCIAIFHKSNIFEQILAAAGVGRSYGRKKDHLRKLDVLALKHYPINLFGISARNDKYLGH